MPFSAAFSTNRLTIEPSKFRWAMQVLPPQQHLQPGLGQQLAVGPESFPWVFIQEAEAGMESRPAPAFQRPVARVIQVFTHRDQVIERHAGFQKALLRFSQQQFRNFHGACHSNVPSQQFSCVKPMIGVFRRVSGAILILSENPTPNESGPQGLRIHITASSSAAVRWCLTLMVAFLSAGQR